jgi:HIRAN domain
MAFRRRKGKRANRGEVMLLEGDQPLQVVGESFNTDSFERLAREYRTEDDFPIIATLEAEPDNAYDPNAVVVKVHGLKVGHLDRETAAKYQPAIVRMTAEYGCPVALRGFVNTGYGDRIYSVWLDHNPSHFEA